MRPETARAALVMFKRDVRVNYSEMGSYNAVLHDLEQDCIPTPKPAPAQPERPKAPEPSARERRLEAAMERRRKGKKAPPKKRPGRIQPAK